MIIFSFELSPGRCVVACNRCFGKDFISLLKAMFIGTVFFRDRFEVGIAFLKRAHISCTGFCKACGGEKKREENCFHNRSLSGLSMWGRWLSLKLCFIAHKPLGAAS